MTINLVSDNHGLTKVDVVWAYPLVYIINSEIVFVVCLSRTIFGMKEGAHVQIEQEKHGNMDTELNMVCTQ